MKYIIKKIKKKKKILYIGIIYQKKKFLKYSFEIFSKKKKSKKKKFFIQWKNLFLTILYTKLQMINKSYKKIMNENKFTTTINFKKRF